MERGRGVWLGWEVMPWGSKVMIYSYDCARTDWFKFKVSE